ncbi:MAG: hypothetical protein LBQ44_03100, partial [Treponema sp.]|nr:hypothetical protein [Treponema sp.]
MKKFGKIFLVIGVVFTIVTGCVGPFGSIMPNMAVASTSGEELIIYNMSKSTNVLSADFNQDGSLFQLIPGPSILTRRSIKLPRGPYSAVLYYNNAAGIMEATPT